MTNLNDDVNIEMRLEAKLRADAVNFQRVTIANDQFSDAVMALVVTLPAPAAALSTKKRFVIIASATLFAVVFAVTAGAGGAFLIDAVMDLATKTVTPAVVVLSALILAASVMAASAARSE
jgi:hypothetical protein